MRLQVFLSHNGVCSRRKAMTLIQEGHVSLDGKIISEPSFSVDPLKDRIQVDGRDVKTKQFVYILLNKPRDSVTTTTDRFREKIVLDFLPPAYRFVKPVGRLDKDTEGLLLLTNDGTVGFRMTHPKFQVDKTYEVRIGGRLSSQDQRKIEEGILLEDKKTAPARISQVRSSPRDTHFQLTIREGRKRQIRCLLQNLGYYVISLKRIRQGPLDLGSLPTGRWRFLEEQEIALLKRL